MKIQIKLFDTSLPVPEYKTSQAAAFDLYARLETELPAGQVTLVPLNVALKLPSDHWALMSARSSLHKKGLMMANGIGVGDADFSGNDDEYRAALYNYSDQPVTIEKGERIVQMIILPRQQVELVPVEKLDEVSRGGFGSTGKK